MNDISRIGIHKSVSTLFPPTAVQEALQGAEPDIEIVETADEVSSCDALITFAYEDSLLSANLEWIHSIQAGVDRFPFETLEEYGIHLTSSTGLHGDSVGETVAGYMLMHARGLDTHRTNQTHQEWMSPAWNKPFTLLGESLCVIGLGTIGKGIARRADALGMNVTGVKRTSTPVNHVQTVFPPADLHQAVADARFVALAVPLTEETDSLISEAELATMRDDAYLINIARGGVVEQSSLIVALESSNLAGAALDVFETEPLPAESPLWNMDNVLVTPHSASADREYYQRISGLVRENLRRFDTDESLVNGVV